MSTPTAVASAVAGVLWVVIGAYAWTLFCCPWLRPFKKVKR